MRSRKLLLVHCEGQTWGREVNPEDGYTLQLGIAEEMFGVTGLAGMDDENRQEVEEVARTLIESGEIQGEDHRMQLLPGGIR